MRKYRVIEIATAGDKIYAVERKVLWFMWMQVDKLNCVSLSYHLGHYDLYIDAVEAMEKFIIRDQHNHALRNNRRVI